ncbi:MAG: 1-acyl-sn-glycerol-3-phosphate acyltransferase [Pseudolabrys sp.]|nr:1-acyl-sn-glycerol-3-phosphate acyltransferase [Pseudolabrys sp.]
MTTSVELPLWLVVFVSVLAVLAALDYLLLPSARWVMRRRFNRAIEELNTRLKLRIQPFKLAKRQSLIDQLVFDPEVINEIEVYAKANNITRTVAQDLARSYAREIVPSFSAYAYFGIGARLSRWLCTLLYRVRLGYMDADALKTVDPDSSVIFVINHRSNMDYVLVTFMASSSSALSYAVGEWARVWLLQSLIRSMGAYFVRRDSRDPLYRKVLARYVHMAVAGGLAQAVFPEGGLTRDGKLQKPKLGLIGYMVAGFDAKASRDAVFVPVGINYDRVLEDRLQLGVLAAKEGGNTQGAKAQHRFNAGVLGAALLRHILLALRGRWYRFGYACVSFGAPLSLRQYVTERGIDFRTMDQAARFAEVEKLADVLMAKVGKVVPVLPVALMATVLRDASGPLSLLELKSRALALTQRLAAGGSHVHIPRGDQDYAIDVGMRMLRLRHLVEEVDGLYRANPAEMPLINYYANSIAHLPG